MSGQQEYVERHRFLRHFRHSRGIFRRKSPSPAVGTHTRSNSFPVPMLMTESTYSANLSPSPAVSFLSKFAEPDVGPGGALSFAGSMLKENCLVGHYVIGRLIGRGTFSEIREGYDINHPERSGSDHRAYHSISSMENILPEPVALKIIRYATPSDHLASFQKELSIWRSLDHPNILPLVEVLESDGAIVAVSPLASHGDLLHYLTHRGPLSLPKARHIFKQLVSAVAYLHSQMNIFHRDVKLDNILLHKNEHVYLCDFGLSEYMLPPEIIASGRSAEFSDIQTMDADCICGGSVDVLSGQPVSAGRSKSQQSFTALSMPSSPMLPESTTMYCTGTIWYCPPEELMPGRTPKCVCVQYTHGHKSDVWSLGVVLYALLSGSLPFTDEFLPRVQMAIQSGDYRELPESIPADVKQLVRSMLTVDFAKRYSTRQVLGHAWLQDPGLPLE